MKIKLPNGATYERLSSAIDTHSSQVTGVTVHNHSHGGHTSISPTHSYGELTHERQPKNKNLLPDTDHSKMSADERRMLDCVRKNGKPLSIKK